MCSTGEGPFPGIIDLYTLGGTVCEPRAALLANKGFVVFALAFYGYQDMPKTVDKLDLEYFEEGVRFLQTQPKVSIQYHRRKPEPMYGLVMRVGFIFRR